MNVINLRGVSLAVVQVLASRKVSVMNNVWPCMSRLSHNTSPKVKKEKKIMEIDKRLLS